MTISKNSVRLLAVVLGAIILSIGLLVTLNTPEKDETKELGNYFGPNQLEELERLTGFIVRQLSANCDSDQTKCLIEYFNRFKGESDYRLELTGISKSEQTDLLNSLSSETYNDIWATCKGTISYSKDSVVNTEFLCPRTTGRFAIFLKDYCSNHERLNAYGNTFIRAGDYSPNMNFQLFENPSTFDMTSKEELLIISIHLITLNNEDNIIDTTSLN